MGEVQYKAQAVSRARIRAYAQGLRKKLGLENVEYIDIIRLIEFVFPEMFRQYGFSVEVMPKEKMGGNHGLTNPLSGQIFVREDVYEGACKGSGRDRMTIAHEVGHFLLHDGVTLGMARTGEKETVPTYCDPEWQATAFAAEFLMDHELIQSLSAQEIAKRCGVSYDAACYQKRK